MVDAGLARLGLPRIIALRRLAPTIHEQASWLPSVIFGHNSPQLVPLVDTGRHVAILYAHNNVLKTYGEREAGRTLRRATGIICVSDFLAEETRSHVPKHLHERIRVVHNGVDIELFRRTTPLRSAGALRVVFVGRMIREKGADIAIEAVRRLGRPDIHLTLIGSRGFDSRDPLTDYERQIHGQAARLGNHISIYPFLPPAQVARILSSSDVLVVPSRWPEPFALTVREGQAAGLAVVASDIGGIPEALGGRGLLVPPDKADAIADALAALADDACLLHSLSTAGRSFAEEYNWSFAAAKLETIVRDLTS